MTFSDQEIMNFTGYDIHERNEMLDFVNFENNPTKRRNILKSYWDQPDNILISLKDLRLIIRSECLLVKIFLQMLI